MITLESKDILGCCASKNFSALLAARSPFPNVESVLNAAHDIWWNEVSVPDWLEAFRAHPRIGDVSALRHGTDRFSNYSKTEQSVALQGTTSQVQQELVEWNKKYEERFGHIFLIFAAGKSSAEILATLRERYNNNSPYEEIQLAATEQERITAKRLTELINSFQASESREDCKTERRTAQLASQLQSHAVTSPTSSNPGGAQKSPITTHVLDTCHGRPASGVEVNLLYCTGHIEHDDAWKPMANGVTDKDGRIQDLLHPGSHVAPGHYCLVFKIGAYMESCRRENPNFFTRQGFYPIAKVYFTVGPDEYNGHFHVPLTWNPYGYSTYRGS